MSQPLQQTSPIIGVGLLADRPLATGAGMEEGYLYFAIAPVKTLFILQIVAGVKTWVPAAAAA